MALLTTTRHRLLGTALPVQIRVVHWSSGSCPVASVTQIMMPATRRWDIRCCSDTSAGRRVRIRVAVDKRYRPARRRPSGMPSRAFCGRVDSRPSCSTPRILPVIDFFNHEGEWFSLFPRIADAHPLHEIIASIHDDHRPPYSIAEFVTLSAGVTDGLAAIHRAGFVHRTLGTSERPRLTATVMSGWLTWVVPRRLAQTMPLPERFVRSCGRPRQPRSSLRPKERSHQPPIAGLSVSRCSNCATVGIHTGARRRRRVKACAPASWRGELTFPTVCSEPSEELLQPWLRPTPEACCCPTIATPTRSRRSRNLRAIAATIDMQRPVARAFVAMPFAPVFDAVWRAIWSACAMCRVSASRVDQSHLHENIWDEICAAISASDLTVAVASPEPSGVPTRT